VIVDKDVLELVLKVVGTVVALPALHWLLVGRVWNRTKLELEILKLMREDRGFEDAEQALRERLSRHLAYLLKDRRKFILWGVIGMAIAAGGAAGGTVLSGVHLGENVLLITTAGVIVFFLVLEWWLVKHSMVMSLEEIEEQIAQTRARKKKPRP
jgi:hypothetical protein